MQLPVTLALDRRRPLARLLVRRDVRALTLRPDGCCEVERTDGIREVAAVDPSSTAVYPWLVVLHYRVSGRRASLALPPSAVGSRGHRLLRVWLRWCMNASSKRHESA